MFLLVALSYAEGVAAMPETGGAETFTRRAYNDLAGFVAGWSLFLDYLIVIALSALFLPHYVGAALEADVLRDSPWDVVVSVSVIALIGAVRLVRRTRLHMPALVVALLDLVVQSLIVILGLALVFSTDTLVARASRSRPDRTGSTTSCSPCRSASSPTRGSRRSRTSPRRRASRDARCRARSSRRSASWSS